ncbi:IgGFc-binding protein [Nannocystis exedens]|uniref:IgGFc-binding protein n=1 Tax=Nannocystis exedens TaxID=54 RepID=UPI000C299C8E|nr:IgGFc-binding protein [Nannocystis exedens]
MPKHSSTTRALILTLLVPVACGDDAAEPTVSATQVSTVTNQTTLDTTGSTGVTTDATTDSPTTGMTGTSASSSGPTTTSATTTDTTTTTTATTSPLTDSDSDTADTTDTTGANCSCQPGETQGCDPGGLLTCKDDCSGFEPVPCPNGQSCVGDQCTAKLCNPGQTVCEGLDAEKTCNAQGDGFEPPVACGATQECSIGGCTELCELIKSDPSSVGCVFRGNKMQNFAEEPTAITVGNVSKTKTATVAMYFYSGGAEQMVAGPIQVPPGQSAKFDLTMPPQPGTGSTLRVDSTFKVVSNVPVVAYQHSPIEAEAHNDSSMLLPDHAQQKNYIIAAFTPSLGAGQPAYFNVIGVEDGTVVTWTPPTPTLAGGGVPAVAANQTGMITVNDYDLLQVSGGANDVSGTIVTLSKPGWVVGAVQCVNIPANVTFCDHIEEQMIPIEYWGLKYVGAHAPKRGSEDYWWRVYASEDNTTITTEPLQPGFPVTLDKGKFYQFSTQSSFIFTGDKPFMPVQYLEGQDGGAGTGDPASYQMVPVEQFLDRYVFVTGIGYNPNYVQVVRDVGAPDVLVDGVVVSGYYTVGDYEVADWKIGEGTHLAESAAPFGIYQVGYTAVTSYAYPGGLRLKVINPQ